MTETEKTASFLESQVLRDGDKFDLALNELRRLQGENMELRKDADRLDWMEKDQASRVFHIVNNWYTRKSYGMPWKRRKDLRDAIDASKEQTQ